MDIIGDLRDTYVCTPLCNLPSHLDTIQNIVNDLIAKISKQFQQPILISTLFFLHFLTFTLHNCYYANWTSLLYSFLEIFFSLFCSPAVLFSLPGLLFPLSTLYYCYSALGPLFFPVFSSVSLHIYPFLR